MSTPSYSALPTTRPQNSYSASRRASQAPTAYNRPSAVGRKRPRSPNAAFVSASRNSLKRPPPSMPGSSWPALLTKVICTRALSWAAGSRPRCVIASSKTRSRRTRARNPKGRMAARAASASLWWPRLSPCTSDWKRATRWPKSTTNGSAPSVCAARGSRDVLTGPLASTSMRRDDRRAPRAQGIKASSSTSISSSDDDSSAGGGGGATGATLAAGQRQQSRSARAGWRPTRSCSWEKSRAA
mmetsp:Transcript_12994/g.38676  ORF Transcript_12994/g.38676 Transcript_12994/m.38676 type:complete len:242 (+) Transcript_12994:139-864(+)